MTTTLPPKQRITYLRPEVVALHAELFREPVYEDGEPYTDLDDEDEERDL